jgi:hypothetical protein
MMEEMSAFEQLFRAHFNTTFSRGGASYEEYAPAYQYGYDLAHDAQYANQEWYELEDTARQGWEQQHGDMDWSDVREAIYRGWQSVRE